MKGQAPLLIHWHLMFRVANRRAFNRCLTRTMPLLGQGAKLKGDGKQYWKTPALWECVVVAPRVSGTPAEQAYHGLLLAMGLGVGWHVSGPITEDSVEEFEGVFDVRGNHSFVTGLEWAHFQFLADAPASS